MARKKTEEETKPEGLSTGSTLLNLAITGKLNIGYECGTYNYYVGSTSSGKSWVCLASLAEAANNGYFNDHTLIYDNVEDGAKMDIARYFGQNLVDRLRPPMWDDDNQPVYSSTIEEFYFNLEDALDVGPCVYVLDSMDALGSEGQSRHFAELKKAVRKGKDKLPGSYGDGKAKANSQNIRLLLPKIQSTGSILLLISQERDNIDAGPFSPKSTRSGGRALSFYAQSEVWSSVRKKIKTTVGEKDYESGTLCEMKVRRSRLGGRVVSVQVPILYGAGIDDVGSLVDFLVEEGVWKKAAGYVNPTGLSDESGQRRDGLISWIEESNLESEVKELVLARWKEIETAITTTRKPRYT